MDNARKQTDKELKRLEQQIGRVYKLYPALLVAEKKMTEYLKEVDEQTKKEYDAYQKETDRKKKEELKKAYADKVEKLTLKSPRYKRLQDMFTTALAQANQAALDITNKAMPNIYMINYNQVANDCEKIGIKVNGET